MKPYPKYKPTNIDWIGEIPWHWSSRKVAWSFKLIGSGTTPKSDSDLYYENGSHNWLLTGDLTDGDIFETSKKITDLALIETSSLKKYPINSIVMAMYGATIGKLGILKIETTTNQACCVLADSPFFDYKFVFYWMLSSRESIINLSYGGGQPNINQDIVKGLRLTYPPLLEQQAIVTYLDQKTTLIDELIAKKQRKIKLLKENRTALINHAVTKGLDPTVKYKDSGIEWIGEIPEHWEIKPLKLLITINDETLTEKFDKDIVINYIEISDVNNTEGIKQFSQMFFGEAPSRARRIVRDGDVIVSTVRTYLKAISRIEKPVQNLIVSTGFAVLRPRTIDSKYLGYFTSSDFFISKTISNSYGVSYPAINSSEIGNFKSVIPSATEQLQIVDYLDTQTSLIDQNINLELQKIEKLKEYRQSLISNVVTGKICVLED